MLHSLSAARHALASVIMLAIVTVALGFGYPLVITGISQLFFRGQANGSLVRDSHGTLIGSALLGQSFTNAKGNPLPQYFQPRPSDAGSGYQGNSSGASNLGPSNPVLIKLVTERAQAYRVFNGLPASTTVPVDAVTASGSGLDPDISVANALDQAARVARARHLPAAQVVALVHKYTTGAQWEFLSEPVVNVLRINLALDGQR
jgi:potassium-transporting ATPase KdpC subunit